METKITSATGNGFFLNPLRRVFRREPAAIKPPVPKVAFCVPAGVLMHALFDEDAPFAHLEREEKTKLCDVIEERLYECGWSLEMSNQALDMKDREYQRRFRELSKHGGVFIDHIKSLINKAYDYRQAKERMGRGVPYPWPIEQASDGDSEEVLL